MITGFNTDIDHRDRVFHVQTEDKGLANPVIQTLIYTGGEIVANRQSKYDDQIDSGAYAEDAILLRMEAQHQAMIREILNGKFDTDGPRPLGYGIISNRSLDEVVLEYLAQHGGDVEIEFEILDEQIFEPGTRPTMRLRVVERDSRSAVAGAHVAVMLVDTAGQATELFSCPADDDGFVEAFFEIPENGTADAAIVCRAEFDGRAAEVREVIRSNVDSIESA